MDFEQWKGLHTLQLERIPEIYWEALFTKLCTEVCIIILIQIQ